MSRPGAIHRQIVELLRQNPDGLTSGQIRAKLNIAADEQAQLDRRRRDLRKWFVLEKRQSGNDCVYILKGELSEPVLGRGVNIRVRAAVLGRAHGRCQMCGRTVAQHYVVLVVDHKVPVDWGGSAVPETAVHEQRDFLPPENEVWFPKDGLMPSPASDAVLPEQRGKF